MIARPVLLPAWAPACLLRARLAAAPGTAGPSQLPPGHLVERACELAVPLLPGVQVHPRRPGQGGTLRAPRAGTCARPPALGEAPADACRPHAPAAVD